MAISEITSQKPETLFDESIALEMDDLSHKICLVSRENPNNVQVVKPITQYTFETCVPVTKARTTRTSPHLAIGELYQYYRDRGI